MSFDQKKMFRMRMNTSSRSKKMKILMRNEEKIGARRLP